MADDVDVASENELFNIELAKRNMKANAVQLVSTGCCHNCEEPVSDQQLFCDADCRDDWDKEQAAKRRNGHGSTPY